MFSQGCPAVSAVFISISFILWDMSLRLHVDLSRSSQGLYVVLCCDTEVFRLT